MDFGGDDLALCYKHALDDDDLVLLLLVQQLNTILSMMCMIKYENRRKVWSKQNLC